MKKGKSKIVDIDSIRPRPEGQMRFETLTDAAIAEKAASMKALGQLQPCLVEKNGFIVGGEIRWRAGKLLGWKEIEVQVVSFKDEFERLTIQLAENEQTTPPSQFELAAMYGRMHEEFLKTWEKPSGVGHYGNRGIKDMAAALGIAKDNLGKYLQLNNDSRITPELRALAMRIRLPATTIMAIARWPSAISTKIVQRTADALDKGLAVTMNRLPWNLFSAVLHVKPEAIDAALDILLARVPDHERVLRFKALEKEEKTPAEREAAGLNSLWLAFGTINKAMDIWRDDMTNVPPFCRDMLLAKAGRTYRRLDTFFESIPEFQVEEEETS